MKLCNQIAALRLEQGLTVNELAMKAGISMDQMMRIEHGSRDMPAYIDDKIIRALGRKRDLVKRKNRYK